MKSPRLSLAPTFVALVVTIAVCLLGYCAVAAAHAANAKPAAAAAQTWTQNFIYPNMIGTNPGYAGTPIATSAPFQCLMFGNFTSNDTPPQTANIQVGSVGFDMLDKEHSGQSFTYEGVTATNAQIFGLLNASMSAAYQAQQSAAKYAKPGTAAAASKSRIGGP